MAALTTEPGIFLVQLDEIPQAGLSRTERLPAAWLGTLLQAAYRPASDAVVTVNVTRTGDHVALQGEVSFQAEYDCSRCAETIALPVRLRVAGLFVPDESHKVMLAGENVDEEALEDVYGYEKNSFSVMQPYREALVFALEPYPVCIPECKGLCPSCGVNLNREACRCAERRVDPRWAALAAFREKLEKVVPSAPAAPGPAVKRAAVKKTVVKKAAVKKAVVKKAVVKKAAVKKAVVKKAAVKRTKKTAKKASAARRPARKR